MDEDQSLAPSLGAVAVGTRAADLNASQDADGALKGLILPAQR